MKKYVDFINEQRSELKLNSKMVYKHFVKRLSDNDLKEILKDIDKNLNADDMKRDEIITLMFSLMD